MRTLFLKEKSHSKEQNHLGHLLNPEDSLAQKHKMRIVGEGKWIKEICIFNWFPKWFLKEYIVWEGEKDGVVSLYKFGGPRSTQKEGSECNHKDRIRKEEKVRARVTDLGWIWIS